MNMSASAFFLNFFEQFDVFVLAMVRFLAFFLLLPVFSGQYINNIIRISLAFFIALLAVSSGNIPAVSQGATFFGYANMILSEFAVGITMSFIVYTVFSALLLAGQLMDYQIGFSMVNVFDPVTQIQVPITGNFYYMVAAVMFMQLGGLRYFIHTVFYSFELIPLGAGFIIGNNGLVDAVLSTIVRFFTMGVQISLPIVGTIIIVDVALGLLVKAVPQMNIFAVGMPIKLILGLLILVTIAPLFGEYYNAVYETAVVYTMRIIEGLIR